MYLNSHLGLVTVYVRQGVCVDHSVIQVNSLENLVKISLVKISVQEHVVDLFLVIRRMSELFSHVSVIGKEENACGIPVKAAYRINSLRALTGNQVHNGFAGVRIVRCGNAVFRLVHYDVNLLLTLDNLAVEADLVCLEHLGSKFCNSLTVNGYDTLEYVLVRLPSGAQAGIGDETVQADTLLSLCLWLARLRGVGFYTRLPSGNNGLPSFKLASYLLEIAAGALGSGWLS